ncbi:glycosyl transferase group 1 [Halothece sp. PCC 7418]|uniref:glycosyltransferase family 4 protein n=1 Tax=Halothece sp. (strain PCC 7418) TaxID=65093 RepID=UPI0002A07C48|nr:glycosyltransferase family 4 protein [Halothece sp. PCC 7418]AFZ43693.1 glycosyl transferase group 1 [Halothece sp. PCC 7418]
MKILFVHQNFPGQYKHLAPAMAKKGHTVVALGEKKNLKQQSIDALSQAGIKLITYETPQGASPSTHHYIRGLEAAVRRGQAVVRTALSLKKQGLMPDVVCAHPGWGEALYLKDVFPEARHLYFLEFFYRSRGSDVGFDPEFPNQLDDLFRVRTKNTTLLLSLDAMDWGVSPTAWQRDQHPAAFHHQISLIHDGINTKAVRPNPEASVTLKDQDLTLSAQDEVITYVARNLEPYRGFHTFARSLPEIHRRHPNAHVLILGGDEVSYGRRPPEGQTYRQKYLAEIKDQIDLNRVHFLGKLPYQSYLSVLQVSSAHVYLTYPFVLSWSMLEAMAAGCLVIGSATPPVKEVLRHEENGLLVDFFNTEDLANAVTRVLENPNRMQPLREKARQTVVETFDLETICLPKHIELIEKLAAGKLDF